VGSEEQQIDALVTHESGKDFFGLAIFGVGLPLFALGARRLPPIDTALIGSLEAPLAPLWVWLAFGETPSASTLIGGSIVFAAVGIHLVRGAAAAIPRPAVAE